MTRLLPVCDSVCLGLIAINQYILLMDSTYKTIMYLMSLICSISWGQISPIRLSTSASNALLRNERQQSYEFALNCNCIKPSGYQHHIAETHLRTILVDNRQTSVARESFTVNPRRSLKYKFSEAYHSTSSLTSLPHSKISSSKYMEDGYARSMEAISFEAVVYERTAGNFQKKHAILVHVLFYYHVC